MIILEKEVKNKDVIQTLSVFVSVDKDGNEGIIAHLMNGTWMPFVCADEDRIKSLLPIAIQMQKEKGLKFKILQFSSKEDVTKKFLL